MPTYFFRFFFVPRAPCSPARQKECTLRVRKCCPQSYGPWIGSVDFLAWGAYLGPVSAHGPASWPCSYAVPMGVALPRSPAPMGTSTPPHAAPLSARCAVRPARVPPCSRPVPACYAAPVLVLLPREGQPPSRACPQNEDKKTRPILAILASMGVRFATGARRCAPVSACYAARCPPCSLPTLCQLTGEIAAVVWSGLWSGSLWQMRPWSGSRLGSLPCRLPCRTLDRQATRYRLMRH